MSYPEHCWDVRHIVVRSLTATTASSVGEGSGVTCQRDNLRRYRHRETEREKTGTQGKENNYTSKLHTEAAEINTAKKCYEYNPHKSTQVCEVGATHSKVM